MTFHITLVRAMEILDSRSRPTLSVTVGLPGGFSAHAAVPSGASTGSQEAVELRDNDPTRYHGAGVRRAIGHVNGEIADALRGRDFADQADLDRTLTTLDGTPNASRLGANALVGVSVATARAAAAQAGTPLWQYLSTDDAPPLLPVPHFNIVNGGAHAPNPLEFQEFMVAPLGARTVAEALRAGSEIYTCLRHRLTVCGHSTALGDEGGFAPDVTEPEYALRLLVRAITDAGYPTGPHGVAIALDPAANAFRQSEGVYRVNGQTLTSSDMIARYRQMIDDFPIWSIEDGLAEDDRTGWAELTRTLGSRIQLIGDDIFVTNPTLIAQAVDDHIANAALIKPNQIGTVTETLRAITVCQRAGYAAMISHRSGETDDTFIADLAVGSGCGQIKSGAPARGERVAKYNRLLEIEYRHTELPYGLGR
ncbi:phosphopyruvate hydratase [Streptomyces noursei]|uniref:phosphopyruvate hydratase n=1 Tax=Streptomyces noursei TaxID=1971 RepID=UPI0005C89402|nr:phosphopyruvate hydratase [Streptomyces noursei]